jgi:hypothetical protein
MSQDTQIVLDQSLSTSRRQKNRLTKMNPSSWRGNNSNIKLSILYLCLNNCQNMQWDKMFILGRCTWSSSCLVTRQTSFCYQVSPCNQEWEINNSTLFYIQQIYFFQHSFSYFIYLSYFVLKKNEIRVKPGHLQQIKKMMGLPSVYIFFSA